VPEYDAFGREIADDPLKPLREPPPAAVEPEPEAEPVVAWPDPEPSVAAPPRLQFVRPRRRGGGGLARLIVVLATLAAAGVALVSVGTSVEGGLDSIVESVPEDEVLGPITGIKGDSLIRRANFADAVGTLAGAGLGRPLTMRVAPDRIDATLIAKDGRRHQVQVTAGGELNELASSDYKGGRIVIGDAHGRKQRVL
jgi:hypothetical protein